MHIVMFQSHTCAEFNDRYEFHFDVDNKGAKLTLSVKFTSKEEDEDDFKTDVTLDIKWPQTLRLNLLMYSFYVHLYRHKEC